MDNDMDWGFDNSWDNDIDDNYMLPADDDDFRRFLEALEEDPVRLEAVRQDPIRLFDVFLGPGPDYATQVGTQHLIRSINQWHSRTLTDQRTFGKFTTFMDAEIQNQDNVGYRFWTHYFSQWVHQEYVNVRDLILMSLDETLKPLQGPIGLLPERVIVGSGEQGSQNREHPGNCLLNQLVVSLFATYSISTKSEKTALFQSIIPIYCFVKSTHFVWFEVTDEYAHKLISSRFRSVQRNRRRARN